MRKLCALWCVLLGRGLIYRARITPMKGTKVNVEPLVPWGTLHIEESILGGDPYVNG